jgi:hypothetical protein
MEEVKKYIINKVLQTTEYTMKEKNRMIRWRIMRGNNKRKPALNSSQEMSKRRRYSYCPHFSSAEQQKERNK